MAKPWCSVVEARKEVGVKLEFVKNLVDLARTLSFQRTNAIKHYLNYASKQHALNLFINEENESIQKAKSNTHIPKVKFKTGGGPSRDRLIVNEKYQLTHEQINQIRKCSFYFCQKSIEKIDIDQKEKTQKLMLPLITKNKIYNL